MNFPERSSEMTGTELAAEILKLKGRDREEFFLDQAVKGNFPDFIRATSTITLPERGELEVTCDHLCFGTDEDFIYGQVNIETAQKIADVLCARLPTQEIVDEIWKQAELRLTPHPWGPPYGSIMFSSQRLIAQSRKLEKERRACVRPLTQLTSGNFKDYILVPKLAERLGRTCIYGWYETNGHRIQGVQINAHERTYVDYSQAPRFCSLDHVGEDELPRVPGM